MDSSSRSQNTASQQGSRPRSSTEEIQRLIARTDERYSRIRTQRADIQRRQEAQRLSEEYMQQMPRRWREGDVFTPHDLTGNEMRKWKKRIGRSEDVFDLVGVNPLDHYRVRKPETPYSPAMFGVLRGTWGGLSSRARCAGG